MHNDPEQINSFFKKQSDLCITQNAINGFNHEFVKETRRLMGATEKDDQERLERLKAEASRLHSEVEALTPYVIRANFEAFGVEDMMVTGVLVERALYKTDSLKRIAQIKLPLSELCGLRFQGLAAKLGVNKEDVGFNINVEDDNGVQIGYITSDGIFNYERAPDIRTALSYAIATNGGRVQLIEFFHLEQATEAVLNVIRVNGVEKEIFFGHYFKTLRRIFVYERTSRFGDGHHSSATCLWQVATRQLGTEHPGYSFAC